MDNFCLPYRARGYLHFFCSYVTEAEFGEIVKFMSEEKFLLASDCIEYSKDFPGLTRMLVYLGGDDFDEEGTWRRYSDNTEIEYIPWAAGRPASGGVDYGCMTLMMMVRIDNITGSLVVKSAELWDEECYRPPGYCTLCSVPAPVARMKVRGLCKESFYDREYFYNIGEGGQIMFLGKEESMIRYNTASNAWHWTDRNHADSLGRRYLLI